jgi:hypothetical protein
MKKITHDEKLLWMLKYCKRNNVTLELQGECGIGRECVGIIAHSTFPDYEWYTPYDPNSKGWYDGIKRLDSNGDVWVPENAYHKHPCVAVLGRGEKAEAQLYEWLMWFDDNNFKVEITEIPKEELTEGDKVFGQFHYVRMVKVNKENNETNN